MCAASPRISASRSTSTSRSATSRRCRSRSAARNMDRAERKFDVMQELGAELVLVCSNTQPSAIDDDSRAAGRPRRDGRARPPPRPARRLRGAVLGPQHPPLGPCLAHRPASGAPRARPDRRQFPHPRPPRRPGRHRRRARRPPLLRPARRRAAALARRAVLEPAFPQFPLRGRAADREVRPRRARQRLQRAALARSVQRPFPRRTLRA